MAVLDYALLAEFVRIEPAGLITVVGGSFSRIMAEGPSTTQLAYVGMRILLDEAEKAAAFQVKLEPPSKQFTIEIASSAQRNPAAKPVDGKVGVMAMVGMTVPITEAGRYVVSITLEGELVRELPFEVEFASDRPS